MARTATTHDVFNAIAEPKRRVLIDQLMAREMAVNELVAATRWRQPVVSKHLGVLRTVGIVRERRDGRRRLYRLNPVELKPIQEWIHKFEKYWGGTLDQLDDYLTDLNTKRD